jgi:hypothetical protein
MPPFGSLNCIGMKHGIGKEELKRKRYFD